MHETEGNGDILKYSSCDPALATVAYMPRTARATVGSFCYHVLNRGNARTEVFHHEGD